MSRRLHDWLVATWYAAPPRGRWLQPLACLFAGVVRIRRALYARGFLPGYRSSRPVIVVGNLTVGGPVAVGTRRADAVRLLEADCDVIVCDDGLQHYGLARDVEIAVVDGARGLGNGRLLPAGPLREPVARLAEVDAVVVNGTGFDWPGAMRMRLEPGEVRAVNGQERRALADFSGQSVIAVAAIGHPDRFFGLLRAQGLRVEARALPDHAVMTPAFAGIGEGRPVLMTEKDAVKCTGQGWQDAWYLEVGAELDAGSAQPLLDRIARLVAAGTQGSQHRE